MVEQYQRNLLAAQGYCELGMYEDALAEVAALPPEAREHPAVVEMRLVILMQARHWPDALEASRELCRLRPEASSGFIHAAFCLHEQGHTREALQVLQAGPPSLLQEANYFYNLACYECMLGNLDAAQAHLSTSLAMDEKYREYARTDPDLRGLRERDRSAE